MAKTAGLLKKTIEQRIIGFIDEFNLLRKGDKLLLALSGGPDSVFALLFLHKYAARYKIMLEAAHINHCLRGKASDDDELFCRSLTGSMNISFFSRRVDVISYARKNKMSVEEAARALRYNVLEELAETNKYDKIVTAHNMNDNTETVLLNLIKGTGLRGISGIPPVRGRIIRPFLCLKKDEILEYLAKDKTEYRTDETNKKNDYERNFIRNILLPYIKGKLNPSAEQNIFNSSVNFRNIQYFLDGHVDEAFNDAVEMGEDQALLNLEKLALLHPALMSEVVKKLVTETFSAEFEYKDLSRIRSLAGKQPGRLIELGQGLIVYRERDSLLFTRKETADQSLSCSLKSGETASLKGRTLRISEIKGFPELKDAGSLHEYVCADGLEDEFTFRVWQPGDKFIPLGMSGFKKVSDFLAEQKIPASVKKDQLVLCSRNSIVWVAGLRIDNRFKITSNSRRILELCLE